MENPIHSKIETIKGNHITQRCLTHHNTKNSINYYYILHYMVERNEDLDLSHDDSENSSSEELAQWRTPNRLRSRGRGSELRGKRNKFRTFGNNLGSSFKKWIEEFHAWATIRGLSAEEKKLHFLDKMRNYALREIVREFEGRIEQTSLSDLIACVRKLWHGDENRQVEFQAMSSVKQDINQPWLVYLDTKLRAIDMFSPNISSEDKILYFIEGMHAKLQNLVKRRRKEYVYTMYTEPEGDDDANFVPEEYIHHDFSACKQIAGEEMLMLTSEMDIKPTPKKKEKDEEKKKEQITHIESNVIICRVCGGKGHKSFQCPSYDNKAQKPSKTGLQPMPRQLTCWTCGAAGHRAFACPNKRQNHQNLKRSRPENFMNSGPAPKKIRIHYKKGAPGSVNTVQDGVTEIVVTPTGKVEVINCDLDYTSVNVCSADDILRITAKLNGFKSPLLVDSGAKRAVMSKSTALRIGLFDKREPCLLDLRSANNSPLEVLGEVDCPFSLLREGLENCGLIDENINLLDGLEIHKNHIKCDCVNNNDCCDSCEGIEKRTTKFNSSATKMSEELNLIRTSFKNIDVANAGPAGEHQKYLIRFVIVDLLSVPALIGMPTINELGIIINGKEKYLELDGEKIYYQQTKRKPVNVVNTIRIKSGSIGQVLVSGNFDATKGLMEIRNKIPLPAVCVTPGVMEGDGNTNFYVRVRNHSKDDITFKAGTQVAELKEIADWKSKSEALISGITSDSNEIEVDNFKWNVKIGTKISAKDRRKILKLVKKEKELFRTTLTGDVKTALPDVQETYRVFWNNWGLTRDSQELYQTARICEKMHGFAWSGSTRPSSLFIVAIVLVEHLLDQGHHHWVHSHVPHVHHADHSRHL